MGFRSLLDPGDWLAMKPQLDPEAASVEFHFSPAPDEIKVRLWLGLILVAVASMAVFFLWGDAIAVFVAGGIGVLGLLILVYGILQSRFSMSMVISRSEVAFDSKTLFGKRSWRESLSAYQGILLREEELTGEGTGKIRTMKRYYIVELLHGDASKTLPLHVREGGVPPRDIQQAFARRLNLPPLVPDVSGMIAPGLARAAPDPGPPPSGLVVREVDGITCLTIERGWKGMVLGYLLWLLFPAAAFGLAYQIEREFAPLVAAMAAGLVVVVLGIGWLMNRKRDRFPPGVCIGVSELWIGCPGIPPRMVIPFAAIEQVSVDLHWGHSTQGSRKCVRLVVDGGGQRLEFLSRSSILLCGLSR